MERPEIRRGRRVWQGGVQAGACATGRGRTRHSAARGGESPALSGTPRASPARSRGLPPAPARRFAPASRSLSARAGGVALRRPPERLAAAALPRVIPPAPRDPPWRRRRRREGGSSVASPTELHWPQPDGPSDRRNVMMRREAPVGDRDAAPRTPARPERRAFPATRTAAARAPAIGASRAQPRC